MTDPLNPNVPYKMASKVLEKIKEFPKTDFLLLTKNPKDVIPYFEYKEISSNVIIGATIESNRNYRAISKAPKNEERIVWMEWIAVNFKDARLMVSIEPILTFDIEIFGTYIKRIRPEFVYVGYDNYGHNLPEPLLSDTRTLIEEFSKFTEVRLKTIRKAWWEK